MFTFPFCYTPRPEIVAASRRLIARIDADPALRALFAEGKMLGVLEVDTPGGETDFLYGFSGLAGGRNRVEGFVPPIYDLLDPDGHFKQEEAAIVALTRQISALQDPEQKQVAIAERRSRSIALQEWIFEQFIVSNARGERLSIAEVFARQGLVPPGGTGECAAPKLLQYAYRHGLKPLAMGEFWYGASPAGEIRRQGSFYPSCTGKCGPLLRFMLEGLDVEPDSLQGSTFETPEAPALTVVYEDEAILLVDKPSGLLAVPGRANPRSAQALLEPGHGPLYPCHRLDMDTSGLLLFAKTPEDQAALQQQFAARSVRKTYRATLVAPEDPAEQPFSPGDHGWIELPLGQDWFDRPRQQVDKVHGKPARTEYEILAVRPSGEIEVRFTPHTGRTHQLRVHAAHPEGLGRPILGDRLYGGHTTPAPLQLRADSLTFVHPRTRKTLSLCI